MSHKISVLLADDHLVVRMGLAAIIELEKDMTVVGEACDGSEAVRLAAELNPDVIVMDLMMPKLNGADATSQIVSADPNAKILMLTTFGTSECLRHAMDHGAIGVLVKDSSHAELIAAIRATARGERNISPVVDRQLKSTRVTIVLTPRQIEIMEYVAKGLNNSEIASLMGIGRDCVKAHLKTTFARLGAASRTEAVAIALREKIITP